AEGWIARVKFAPHAVVLRALAGEHQGKARFGLDRPFRARGALRVFQSLDKDLQEIVKEAAKISAMVGRGMQQLLSSTGLETCQKGGMEIYQPTTAELAQFKSATQQPVIDWLKTQVDPNLINELLKAVDEASK
ncbi:MAG TPA: hypothetical protein PLW63_03200, partial [Bacillota bacterium]|nr:hypothetical protein [Bacillota bacterium]